MIIFSDMVRWNRDERHRTVSQVDDHTTAYLLIKAENRPIGQVLLRTLTCHHHLCHIYSSPVRILCIHKVTLLPHTQPVIKRGSHDIDMFPRTTPNGRFRSPSAPDAFKVQSLKYASAYRGETSRTPVVVDSVNDRTTPVHGPMVRQVYVHR